MKEELSLFLDSGAFSAMTQGAKIELQDYIDFIKEHKKYIDVYAALDVIGNPVASHKNYLEMKKQGLNPIPVYHLNDFDPTWLVKIMAETDYIAIGGMVGTTATGKSLSRGQAQSTLDELFTKYICDEKGLPKVKVHGFGLTSLPWMIRYPWYSVDSTTWQVHSRMGEVLVPKFVNGQYVYNDLPWKVAVSVRSSAVSEAGEHITTMTDREKEIIERYFKLKNIVMGKSEFKFEHPKRYKLKDDERWQGKAISDTQREVEVMVERGISNDYIHRDRVNVIYFHDLEDRLPKWPWAFKLGKTSVKLGL